MNSPSLMLLTGLCLLTGCHSLSDQRQNIAAMQSCMSVVRESLKTGAQGAVFSPGHGPVPVELHENHQLSAGEETILTDNFVPGCLDPKPLAIIAHGNRSRKEAHRYQAMHMASWGIHTLVVQLPNTGEWLANGRRIRQMVREIIREPDILGGGAVNVNRIILAGHSFGGSAVTLAASEGISVAGIILLDPAVVSKKVITSMKRVNAPTILLGADTKVFRARKRRQFFKTMGGPMIEVSVSGATHDDAQSPSMFSLSAFGFDPYTSREKQKIFSAALTVSALSFAGPGDLDRAWRYFNRLAEAGKITKPRKRDARVSKASRTSQQRNEDTR